MMMITIADLHVDLASGVPVLDVDPLSDDDALQEAQLLSSRLEPANGSGALLLDMRTALQLRDADTGVLVMQGIRTFSWTAPHMASTRTAWSIGGSEVRREDGLLRLELGLWPSPGARMVVAAESAVFFAGRVHGLRTTPPDYVADDEATIRSNLPGWASSITLVAAAHSHATR